MERDFIISPKRVVQCLQVLLLFLYFVPSSLSTEQSSSRSVKSNGIYPFLIDCYGYKVVIQLWMYSENFYTDLETEWCNFWVTVLKRTMYIIDIKSINKVITFRICVTSSIKNWDGKGTINFRVVPIPSVKFTKFSRKMVNDYRRIKIWMELTLPIFLLLFH